MKTALRMCCALQPSGSVHRSALKAFSAAVPRTTSSRQQQLRSFELKAAAQVNWTVTLRQFLGQSSQCASFVCFWTARCWHYPISEPADYEREECRILHLMSRRQSSAGPPRVWSGRSSPNLKVNSSCGISSQWSCWLRKEAYMTAYT